MRDIILQNTNLFIRLILSLAFFGHGLVSLGYSSSYDLHYNLVQSINFTNISSHLIVELQGWLDILISALLIIKIKLRQVLYFSLFYFCLVCIAAMTYYWSITDSIFGIAECLRRFPWIFLSLYLLFEINGVNKYHFIRIALSFAFLAHGFASLGFLGLNQGHIDLAIQIVSTENARSFVFYSGITDSIIGCMLLQGVYTRYVSGLSILWLIFIVSISFLSSIPEGIFRSGFLLLAIYIFLDNRTDKPKLI
tara:strand:+ start:254 stop:1006 length:753 start_codon:yes stop_codon:yes gene_type:complete